MVAKAELLSLAESAGRADRVGRNSGAFFWKGEHESCLEQLFKSHVWRGIYSLQNVALNFLFRKLLFLWEANGLAEKTHAHTHTHTHTRAHARAHAQPSKEGIRRGKTSSHAHTHTRTLPRRVFVGVNPPRRSQSIPFRGHIQVEARVFRTIASVIKAEARVS